MSWPLSSKWKIWWILRSLWRKTCPVWCATYNRSNFSKNNLEKTLCTLCLRPATSLKKRLWHRLFFCEFSKISKNTFSYRTPPVAAAVIVYYTMILTEADLGHLKHVGWSSLWQRLVARSRYLLSQKKSILVSAGILDPPLLQIEMSKLNMHHTLEKNFTKYFLKLSWM